MLGNAERYARLEKVRTLLELALGEVAELERDSYYVEPLVVSPTPARDTLLRRSVEMALDQTLSDRDHSRLCPEQLHPPMPSYEERRER